jgi:hypothetical protein
VCLAANYYGFIEGVNLTSPSIAQVFIQLGPVLLAVSGFAFFHEKVSLRQVAGHVELMTPFQVRELAAGEGRLVERVDVAVLALRKP